MKAFVFMTVMALAIPAAATAQDPAAGGSAKENAKRLFDEAVEQLDAGRGALGRDLLRRSLALYPTVATRYNLGVALRQTGETSEAIATFQGLLEAGGLNIAMRDKTSAQLQDARAELATLRIAVTGTREAIVEIDGRQIGRATADLPVERQVDAGERVVVARADGTSRQWVQLERGETKTVTLHVIPSADKVRADKRRRRKRAAWITVAAVVTAGVVTAVAVTQVGGTKDLVPTDTGNIATLRGVP